MAAEAAEAADSASIAKCPLDAPKALTPAEAKQVADASTFVTKGMSQADADQFLQTDDGKTLLSTIRAADPNAPPDVIYRRAVDLIQTGSTPPVASPAPTSLVKIVPKGSGVSQYSPFFTTKEELEKIKASGKPLSDCLGLPEKSKAVSYDIYEIKPTKPTSVFSSRVAPTEELGGALKTGGGGTQTLVPDRSAWSEPKLIGSIGN